MFIPDSRVVNFLVKKSDLGVIAAALECAATVLTMVLYDNVCGKLICWYLNPRYIKYICDQLTLFKL